MLQLGDANMPGGIWHGACAALEVVMPPCFSMVLNDVLPWRYQEENTSMEYEIQLHSLMINVLLIFEALESVCSKVLFVVVGNFPGRKWWTKRSTNPLLRTKTPSNGRGAEDSWLGRYGAKDC